MAKRQENAFDRVTRLVDNLTLQLTSPDTPEEFVLTSNNGQWDLGLTGCPEGKTYSILRSRSCNEILEFLEGSELDRIKILSSSISTGYRS